MLDYFINKNLSSCLGSNLLYIGNFGVYIQRCIGNLYLVYKLFDNSDQFYVSHLHGLLKGFFTPT